MTNQLEKTTVGQTPMVDNADQPDAQSQYLSFTLGEEIFAIDIQSILEIIEYEAVTTVPMMPSFLKGVINLRGRVVPVIDLAVRIGREATEIKRRTCIVILEVIQDDVHHDLGVIVDAVNEVVEIEADEQESPPSFGAGLRNEFIHGIGKVDEKFVVILDISQALSVAEMSAITESLE